MNVKQVIDTILKSITNEENFFRYRDMILIGENTSGKSNIIKGAIKGLKFKDVYLIDSNNRVIPIKRGLIGDEFDKFKVMDLVKCRIKKDYFNKKDVFSDDSEGEVILGELIKNNAKYKRLFKDILDIEMEYQDSNDFVEDEVEQIYIDGSNLAEISSGIQSMLRILMEVNFAYEHNCKTIFIDEFNCNLDYEASSELFIKLRKNYPNIRFIITSHDIYTLKGVDNADIVRVYKGYEEPEKNICEFFDSNDLENLEMIDRKLFTGTNNRNQKNEKDILIGNALKAVVSGKEITEDEKKQLEDMDELTLRQSVVKEFIFERVGKL